MTPFPSTGGWWLRPLDALPWGLNALEVLVAVVLTLVVLEVWRLDRVRLPLRAFAAPVMLALALFAVSEATQFMTIDEYGISAELLDPAQRGERQWAAGAFRTGMALILPVVRLADPARPVPVLMVLKASWWLLGAALILVLVTLLRRLLGLSDDAVVFTALVGGIALLLPTDQLALKTLNYDMLSLVLAVLAIVLTAVAWETGRQGLGVAAVVVAALAAQEKLSASPVLLALMLVVATEPWTSPTTCRWTKSLARLAALTAAVLAVSGVSAGAFALLGPPTVPPHFGWMLLDPLITWLWPIVGVGTAALMDRRGVLGLVALGLLACAVSVLHALARWPPARALAMRCSSAAGPVTRGLELVCLVGGIVALFTVRSYWAPYHPADPSIIGGTPPLNGVVLHFDAHTVLGHYVRYAGYAAALIVVAIPTAVWALLVVTVLSRVAGLRGAPLPIVLEVAEATALLLPMVAVLARVPIAHRYFNLSILVVALAISLRFFLLLRATGVSRLCRTAVVGVVLALTVVEVAPFRPLFAGFRPWWVEYADAKRPELGQLNASWMGWGEEVMQAGKTIEAACRAGHGRLGGVACSDITLYTVRYHGLWFPGPRTITLRPWTDVQGREPLTNADYYVVNRLSLIQGVVPVPRVAPEFSVSCRGYDEGWVYRGDKLAASGYRFER